MAVNVTQKDRTLRAVIAWAETERARTWSLLERTEDYMATALGRPAG